MVFILTHIMAQPVEEARPADMLFLKTLVLRDFVCICIFMYVCFMVINLVFFFPDYFGFCRNAESKPKNGSGAH